jgi:two-component system, LytTR family, sensor kinase
MASFYPAAASSSTGRGALVPPTEVAPPPEPKQRLRWGFLIIGWLLLGLVFVTAILLQSVHEGTEVPWSKVISELFGWYIWGLLLPVIRWVTLRFPIERPGTMAWGHQLLHWVWRLFVNFVAGVLISSLYGCLDLFKRELISGLYTKHFSLDLSVYPSYFLGSIEYYLLVYFAIVAVLHAVAFYEKYSERELKASRLETQLALAQLQVLKMQLHPHFLFNTLNAISALMHRDVEAADRMIAQLSDLLRLSLDKDDRHEVPLRNELEFLNRYLEIEKIRFRDRLAVELDIDAECMDAQVPKLMLQPLVENSIRYGVAMRSAAGNVTVKARRKGNRMLLEVSDDGPGLPSNGKSLREGVGLANTRARLEQLYGAEHRFELRDGQPSGLQVYMEIPFERRQRRLPVEHLA